jgi:hypothetical protein
MTALHQSARYTDLVFDALRRFPERVAFRQDGRDLSYAQTADLLARWVTILRQRRFEPGHGIGVLSPNRPEVWLGSYDAGGEARQEGAARAVLGRSRASGQLKVPRAARSPGKD